MEIKRFEQIFEKRRDLGGNANVIDIAKGIPVKYTFYYIFGGGLYCEDPEPAITDLNEMLEIVKATLKKYPTGYYWIKKETIENIGKKEIDNLIFPERKFNL